MVAPHEDSSSRLIEGREYYIDRGLQPSATKVSAQEDMSKQEMLMSEQFVKNKLKEQVIAEEKYRR